MADLKISDLTALAALADNDLLAVVDTSESETKKVLLSVLRAGLFTLGLDADGDMYYRSAGILARLAKGAANTKLFMNAGANAPEWAAGMNVVSFTRDMSLASGNVSYTGFGFLPAGMIVVAFMNAVQSFSFGQAMGTTENCFKLTPRVSPIIVTSTGNIVDIEEPNDGSAKQTASINSVDADGVTLAWVKTGSPTSTITGYFIPFR